jgi:glycosyltransferase involved in cell wall biosynthesis
MALVSVIIPTYNRAPYIADAIHSVLAQTYPNVELIVADDGSTDDTAAVVSQFGDSVTYLRMAHRGQPAATRNSGLSKATGDFIAFLDSDDLFMRDKLALQISIFHGHPSVGLVYSNGYYFREDPNQPTGHLLDGLPTPSGDILAELLRGNLIVSPAMVLITRRSLDSAGMFDERPEFFGVEDYDLWLRIAAKVPVVYLPAQVAAIRRHSQGISQDVAAVRARTLKVLASLEAARPQVARGHRAALNEGYARNHGAVALARFEQRQITAGLSHASQALRYSLRTPGWGTLALLQWIRRRHVRGTGALP